MLKIAIADLLSSAVRRRIDWAGVDHATHPDDSLFEDLFQLGYLRWFELKHLFDVGFQARAVVGVDVEVGLFGFGDQLRIFPGVRKGFAQNLHAVVGRGRRRHKRADGRAVGAQHRG